MHTSDQPNLKSLLLVGKLPKVSSANLLTNSTPQVSPLFAPVSPPAPVMAPPVAAPAVPTVVGTPHLVQSAVSSNTQFSSLIPALMTLKGQMMQDLEDHVQRLLGLNPSRREAIATYLDRLAGQSPAPSASSGVGDAAGGLRRWIEGAKTPAQGSALRSYFEEVALIYLSQAILLKAWSDTRVRAWTEADVGRLNWSLSTALKTHVPLDREGWQVTKPNLYSWYTPSPAIQHQVWLALEQTRMSDEGPALLFSIAGPARQARPEATIPHGYDLRFFKSLWNSTLRSCPDLTNDNGPIKRHRVAFSPTLRDGTMVRTGPTNLNWAGMESSPFQLMIAEMMQLWWGPQTPPLWAIGSGLEAHTRDQLSLGLNSPKPSLLSRIADMEACDVSFVLEERIVRSQSRNAEAQILRDQLETLPYFKKLKTSGTSLGDLQACVTLSKLRPGGCLWWAREEALAPQDGNEVLSFILDRAKLVCEWDFSHLDHSLPVSLPLFPKYLYLLTREPNVEARLTHRPVRVTLTGQIRSHIELPLMLEDSLTAIDRQPQARGHWQIHAQTSPTCQKDWADRWPDPECQNTLKSLEKLRTVSDALASVCTIRPIPPNFKISSGAPDGLWIQCRKDESKDKNKDHKDGKRELVVRPLNEVPVEDSASLGFAVLVPNSAWLAPLSVYLGSATVRNWLDHHAERKGEAWILDEQVLRWIPLPRALVKALQNTQLNSMTPEWTQVVKDAASDAKKAKVLLSLVTNQLSQPGDEASFELRMAIFVKIVHILEEFKENKKALLSVVDSKGKIQWNALLRVLPQSELVTLTTHPLIHVLGNLPPHLPVVKIEKVKSPSPGILLATELGFFIHLSCDGSLITDMLWEQLSEAKHPTWSEVVQSVKLPRRVEFAQSTAQEVLRSHAESCTHRDVFSELLSACSIL